MPHWLRVNKFVNLDDEGPTYFLNPYKRNEVMVSFDHFTKQWFAAFNAGGCDRPVVCLPKCKNRKEAFRAAERINHKFKKGA